MANAIRHVNRPLSSGLLAGLTVLAVAVTGGSAAAHPEWSPIRVNRYAKIVLSEPGKLKIVYTILHGDGPALPARKAVDADANGRIDAKEKAMLGARAQAQVAAGLKLTLDGADEHPTPTSIDVGMAGDGVGPEAYSVDLVFVLDTPAGRPHTLVLDDRVEVPSEGDTEISIDEPAPARLLAAYQGRGAAGEPQRVFTFRGPRYSVLEDRSVKIRFETAANTQMWPHPRLPMWAWYAGAGWALLLLVLFGKKLRGSRG